MADRRKANRRETIETNEPLKTQKSMIQKMLWERAKGELNGMIAVCRTGPITEHCIILENKVQDLIMSMESVVYNWQKVKYKELAKHKVRKM